VNFQDLVVIEIEIGMFATKHLLKFFIAFAIESAFEVT